MALRTLSGACTKTPLSDVKSAFLYLKSRLAGQSLLTPKVVKKWSKTVIFDLKKVNQVIKGYFKYIRPKQSF